jgi:uncharacterized membrane protein YphA (DoxX/SURF4 family)
MKNKAIVYWATTIILALAMFSGGVAELVRQRDTVAGMVHLGYPLYFITIIGCWKVLGTIALLVPRFPRVKEWAYAGIFFNMTGAAISHAACGDAAWHVIVTLAFAVLAVASWALRPSTRRLDNLSSQTNHSGQTG